jgi:asparagine synthase (glutamine-hydrolysing)
MEIRARQASATALVKALQTEGLAWSLTRVYLALSNKLGVLERKTPLQSWSDLLLVTLLQPGVPAEAEQYCEWRRHNTPPLFFEEISPIAGKTFVGDDSIRIADQVLCGEFPFFGYSQNLGFPPKWQRNPITQTPSPGGHWSKINEFESGDIKLSWEASRFSWAFALGRAYVCTRDERYAEAFWQLLESWLEQNPPQWGINWKCGQEASFRTMALCFAFYVFKGSASSTAGRLAQFVVAIAIHAKRIDAYTGYAQSQKNNHGISEGVGLWTIGLLFPELKGAARWKARGKQLVESEVRRQLYADGSYIQHSTNYHRVMLHDLAWAIRLGECNNEMLSIDVYDGFRKSIRFLHELVDPETGWAPNYGANDGALVLPLSNCTYPDMRPVLQCCHFIVKNERLYPPGPWDEEMVWLNGLESLGRRHLSESSSPNQLDAAVGGYYTIHSSDSWMMIRVAQYKDRPSHADQLHLDMWWRGENILCDAGSYSYNSAAPFDHGFALTRYHNTVTVDSLDQMTRLSRFRWADWANARIERYENQSTGTQVLEGDHDGYLKLGVMHRRAVAPAGAGTWIIVDDLTGRGVHNCRLQWLIPDVPFEVAASGVVDLNFMAGNVRVFMASSAEANFALVRAGLRLCGEVHQATDPARGWHSRYYGRKEPALSLVLESRSSLPVRFVTVIMLGGAADVEVAPSLGGLAFGEKQVNLSAFGASPIFVKGI